jgi:prepilin-type N-terminal cleavage/methylation domain-containing protein
MDLPDEASTRIDDGGFSLIEILIVTVVLGIIMTALSTAVIVTLNAAPDTEARLDDARSTRSLSTWLSHDTTSTPPFLPEQTQGGINITTTATADNNDCGGAGTNVLHLQWTEIVSITTTHVANYRFVVTGGEAVIRRYACFRVGAGPYTTTFNRGMTPALDPGNPPTLTVDQPADVASVSFTLTGLTGETVLVETGSRNPADFFP